MNNDKELNNKDLNNVSGGSNLDKYLKSLTGHDKSKALIDYGTGVQLDLDSTVQKEDDGNISIIKREKNSPEVEAELNMENFL